MGTKTELLKQILDLKLKKVTETTKEQIQKLQQKVDDLIQIEKEEKGKK
jgi:hypothetical protein